MLACFILAIGCFSLGFLIGVGVDRIGDSIEEEELYQECETCPNRDCFLKRKEYLDDCD